MTNKTETPLTHAQNIHGARFCSSSTPRHYGNVLEEYIAIRERTTVADISDSGIIRVDGKDGLDLLNRLSTNKTLDIMEGEGISTILTTNKGRIIDLIMVLNTGKELILITNPNTTTRIVDWIDLYTFGEDVRVEDITEQVTLFSVSGNNVAAGLTSIQISKLYQNEKINIAGEQVTIIKTDRFGSESYDILMDKSVGRDVWISLIEAGFLPVGNDSMEIVRVEQGIPTHGKELGEDFNPLEAGLEDHISSTKGCYIGQEVILRLSTYQKVQKRLIGMVFLGGLPDNNSTIEIQGAQVGFITSAVHSPILGKTLAMGYLKSLYSKIDQEVVVESRNSYLTGKVVQLPLEYN